MDYIRLLNDLKSLYYFSFLSIGDGSTLNHYSSKNNNIISLQK